jgi:antitoxin component YwqK of YwqJK toxin-antitoxin module
LPIYETEAKERQVEAIKAGNVNRHNESPVNAKLHELAEQESAKPKVKQSTETAAVVTGASARYVSEVKKIKAENPEAYEEIKAGTKTIQDIKSEDKKKKLEEKKQEIIGDTAKEIEGNYKDGKEYGLFTTWYENGQKEIESNYKDGKRDGLFTTWYENGQKLTEGNYKNGKEVIKID